MSFTSLDKALTDRAIRFIQQGAVDHKAAKTINGTYPNTAEGRKDKRRFDALMRDSGDLKALQARMIKEIGDATVMPRQKPSKVIEQEQASDALLAGSAKTMIIPPGAVLNTAELSAAAGQEHREHPMGSAPGPDLVMDFSEKTNDANLVAESLVGSDQEQF